MGQGPSSTRRSAPAPVAAPPPPPPPTVDRQKQLIDDRVMRLRIQAGNMAAPERKAMAQAKRAAEQGNQKDTDRYIKAAVMARNNRQTILKQAEYIEGIKPVLEMADARNVAAEAMQTAAYCLQVNNNGPVNIGSLQENFAKVRMTIEHDMEAMGTNLEGMANFEGNLDADTMVLEDEMRREVMKGVRTRMVEAPAIEAPPQRIHVVEAPVLNQGQ